MKLGKRMALMDLYGLRADPSELFGWESSNRHLSMRNPPEPKPKKVCLKNRNTFRTIRKAIDDKLKGVKEFQEKVGKEAAALIRKCRYGEKLPTVRMIAVKYHIHPKTVMKWAKRQDPTL